MKTSEQMTADVLKRRDEELKALPKKHRIKMAAIGAPCTAAAAALGIVTFNFVHGANEFLNVYGGSLGDYTYMFFHNGRGKYIHSGVATPGSTEGNIEPGSLAFTRVVDYEDWINKNPNAGKYVYLTQKFKDLSGVMAQEKPAPDIEPTDFIEQTIRQLNMSYGIEFDRFGRLHPDWTEAHDRFGYYVHDENDGFVASRRYLSDQNTLNYVTPDGVEISVTAQRYQKFFDDMMMPAWNQADTYPDGTEIIGVTPELDLPEYPYVEGVMYGNPPAFKGVIDNALELDPPEYPSYAEELDVNVSVVNSANKPDNETHYIYDEDGNIVGAYTNGYDPGNVGVVSDNKTDTDEVKTNLYTNLEGTEWLTYLDMGDTWVRIYIKGISNRDDVIKLLDEYTADQSWLDDINSLNNPYHEKYSFKFISGESGLLSSINCVEGYPDHEFLKSKYTFAERGIDELSDHYGFDFDRLGRLHPDWSKTVDRPLGIYIREESPVVDAFTIVSAYNTLNYTAPDGAKIMVTAQTTPFYPANQILECIVIGEGPFIILDEDGNKLDEYEYFGPHYNVNIPDDAENIEIEIYSDRKDPNTHLAYINMGSWVKIRAEGLSDSEFLEILKEYVK